MGFSPTKPARPGTPGAAPAPSPYRGSRTRRLDVVLLVALALVCLAALAWALLG